MTKALRTSVRSGGLRQGGLQAGLGSDNIFTTASLDLNFAVNKNLGTLVDATTGSNLVDFTRASSGTYVGSDGLIKTATTNLVLQSENFSTNWSVVNAATPTVNVSTSPIGTVTADKFIGNNGAVAGNAAIYQDVSGQNQNQAYTISVYAKEAGQNGFRMALNARTSGGAFIGQISYEFDLSTAAGSSSFVSTSGTAPTSTTSSIQAVGNGWFRCSVSGITPATTAIIRIAYYNSATSNGTDGFLLWGAQLEQSTTVGEYVKTTSTINSAPRFDHDPTTGESLGLLVEESRTNLLLRSEEFDQSPWAKSSVTVAGGYLAPNGSNTAYKVTSGGANVGNIYQDPSLGALASGYRRSIWAKVESGTATVSILGRHDATNNIVTLTQEWQRFDLEITDGTFLEFFYAVDFRDVTTTATEVFVWGAQLEAGSFPTSYIPTEGSTVTRAADVASISGSNFSSWFDVTQGAMYLDFLAGYDREATNNWNFASASDGTANNVLGLRSGSGGTTRRHIYMRSIAAGSAEGDAVGQLNVAINTRYKIAGAYAVDNFACISNGESVETDTSGALPTGLDQFTIGGGAGGQIPTGRYSRLTYFSQRLSNSTLQSITQ